MMKKMIAGALTLACVAQAEIIYVDFTDNAAETNTTAVAYNVVTDGGASGRRTPISTESGGSGISLENLVTTDNVATTVDVNIWSYSAFRTAGGRTDNVSYTHTAALGVDASALNDAYWINDQGSAQSFGFILTFTGLTEDAYDISMLAGSNNAGGTWSVTTGTGDTDTQAYSSNYDEIQQWTDVAPVDGTIVLTSEDDGTGNWQTASINFVAIEAVPEPATFGLIAVFGGALMFMRRRCRAF